MTAMQAPADFTSGLAGRRCSVCKEVTFGISELPGYRRKYWLPGGGIEEGEAPEDALIGELAEEAAATVQTMKRIGAQRVEWKQAPLRCEISPGTFGRS